LVVLEHFALENQALSRGGHVRLGRDLCLELTDRGLKQNTKWRVNAVAKIALNADLHVERQLNGVQ
jgi:hypothetical protein